MLFSNWKNNQWIISYDSTKPSLFCLLKLQYTEKSCGVMKKNGISFYAECVTYYEQKTRTDWKWTMSGNRFLSLFECVVEGKWVKSFTWMASKATTILQWIWIAKIKVFFWAISPETLNIKNNSAQFAFHCVGFPLEEFLNLHI